MDSGWKILLNTQAGALRARPSSQQIEESARQVGVEAEVITVPSAEEMRLLARKLVAAGVPRIAVAGGDGTVGLVAQELAHTGVTLGILPQGTFNNFATALRLPMHLPGALRVLHDGSEREVSLGRVGERYFTEAAGVGLFADALEFYGKGPKKRLLPTAYALLRVALPLRAPRLWLTLDGGERQEHRAVLCTVANSFRMGAALPVAPGARLMDDVLDIVIIGGLKRGEALPYFRAIRAQLHPGLPKVTTLQAQEVRIETHHPLNLHCDDQVIGTTPATIRLEPRALKVMVDQL